MPDLKVRVAGAWQSVTTTGPQGPPGPAGSGAAHATTHETGGSDQITGPMAFSTLNLSGNATVGGGTLVLGGAVGQVIRGATASGSDNQTLWITPAGGVGGGRGAYLQLSGMQAAAGDMLLVAGNTGKIQFLNNGTAWGTIHPSGGFSWGNAIDPGAYNLSVAGDVVLTPSVAASIRMATTDGADNKWLQLTGGGAAGAARGATMLLNGNESLFAGTMELIAGDAAAGGGGSILFRTGASVARGAMHPSGGFSWGTTTDPGAGNLSVAGYLSLGNTFIKANTNPGADNAYFYLNAGGGTSVDTSRGAFLCFAGNNSGSPGVVQLVAGNTPTGTIGFYTGASALRGLIHASGGFSLASTIDPGANGLCIGSAATNSGLLYVGTTAHFALPAVQTIRVSPFSGGTWAGVNIHPDVDFTGGRYMTFLGASGGLIGSITQVPGGVAYNATSDARLKQDRGRLTDTSVLQQTIVHLFDWKSSGTAGRGVFAQEAVEVAPFAITVGTDELNEHGQLAKPWGVDYSKYVPDLIVGWQQHDATVHHMANRIEFLEAAIMQMQTRASRQSWVGQLYQRIRAAVTAWWVPHFLTPEKD